MGELCKLRIEGQIHFQGSEQGRFTGTKLAMLSLNADYPKDRNKDAANAIQIPIRS